MKLHTNSCTMMWMLGSQLSLLYNLITSCIYIVVNICIIIPVSILQLLNDAQLVEDTKSGYGVHTAAVMVKHREMIYFIDDVCEHFARKLVPNQ